MLSIVERIHQLRKERDAVILAHNYQIGPIQDVADFVGDSLGLTLQAAKTDARVILFCGVHFMAETVSILCPDRRVIVPDLSAGCGLADMVTAKSLVEWKRAHPGVVVISYINSTAAVKAESDYCCTSTNAEKIVQAVPEEKEILFVPDQYLGYYVQQKTGRKMHLWPGYCPAHARIDPESILNFKEEGNELRESHARDAHIDGGLFKKVRRLDRFFFERIDAFLDTRFCRERLHRRRNGGIKTAGERAFNSRKIRLHAIIGFNFTRDLTHPDLPLFNTLP